MFAIVDLDYQLQINEVSIYKYVENEVDALKIQVIWAPRKVRSLLNSQIMHL